VGVGVGVTVPRTGVWVSVCVAGTGVWVTVFVGGTLVFVESAARGVGVGGQVPPPRGPLSSQGVAVGDGVTVFVAVEVGVRLCAKVLVAVAVLVEVSVAVAVRVGGAMLAARCTAPPQSMRPQPNSGSHPGAPRSTAVSLMICSTPDGESALCTERMRAAHPAT
jgi:hypothetical protein